MNCRTARRQTALLVGDDLNQTEAAELTAHLRGCADCEAHHQELLASVDVLVACNGNPVCRDRESIWPDVRASVEIMETAQGPRRRVSSIGLIVAAACVLFVAVLPELARFSWPATGAMAIPVSTVYDEPVSSPAMLLKGEYVPVYADQSWRVLEPVQRENAANHRPLPTRRVRGVSGY
jgi:anti-sigma factor RsiW